MGHAVGFILKDILHYHLAVCTSELLRCAYPAKPLCGRFLVVILLPVEIVMKPLADIVAFLDRYLAIGDIKDSSYNGLQVEGSATVTKIAVAVDAGIEVFEKARAVGADLVIVHHGLYWKYGDPRHVGLMKERVDSLLVNKMSLYAAHLPLDRHALSGNNAVLVRAAGAEVDGEFAWCEGKNVGWRGTLPLSEVRDLVADRLRACCDAPSARLLAFGPAQVRTVAALSGAASYPDLEAAAAAGIDLFITGEQKEVYHLAKDLGLNVLLLGHNASETTGPRALVPILAEQTGLDVVFVNVETGL